MLFEGHEPGDARGERQDPLRVEGLGEARVHDGRLDPVALQQLGGGERRAHRMAVREDRQIVAVPQRLGDAERDLRERCVERDADTRTARKPQSHRTPPRGRVLVRGPEHLTQLGLVLGRHERHAREDPEEGDVVEALVGPAIVADDPAAVHREHDGQTLHRDVVHDLIEAALEERRVDRDDRHDALRRQAGSEGHRVLLADAHVEQPLRELLEERLQPGPSGHRRGDRDRALVAPQDLADGVGEDRRVLRRARLRGAGRGHAVPLHVVLFGRTVAMTFLAVDVDEDRPIREVARALEHAFDREEVVPVDGSEIGKPKLLEEQVRDEQGLEAVEDASACLFGEVAPGHVIEHLTRDVFRRPVRLGGAQRLEHPRDRADVGRDAHAVVVQHDDQAGPHVPDVVQAFERHARGERAVADDRDDVVILALQVARDGHALGRRDRRPGVAGTELVVLGLVADEESGDAAVLPERAEAVASARQHLVDVRLVAGVPHDLVARRIEHAMHRDGELHGAKAR